LTRIGIVEFNVPLDTV